MQLKARFGDGTTTTISIPEYDTCTVKELKELIQSTTGVSANELRLVYKGRILQQEQQLISDFQFQEGETLHVAKTKATPTASGPQTLPTQPPTDPFAALLDNPFAQAMLSNPQFMQSLIQHDPSIQQLIQDQPEMREFLSDPDFLRQMMDAARNPALVCILNI
jgi:ubiquilin